MEPIYIKPIFWEAEDDKDGYRINIIGHDENNETIMFRVRYQPWFYIGIQDPESAAGLLNHLYKEVRGIVSHEVLEKRGMWGYGAPMKKVIKICFHKIRNYYTCLSLLKKPINDILFPVYEESVSSITKFQTERDLLYSDWIQGNRYNKIKDETKSTCKNEYDVKPDLEQVKKKMPAIVPSVLSLDLEANATNRKAMPKSQEPEDVVFCCCLYYKSKDKIEKHAITLEKCITKENYVIHVVEDEKEMADVFCDLVMELDPDIIMGHNFLKWDLPYWDARLARSNSVWKQMSRYKNYDSKLEKISWESSAYADVELSFWKIPGRILLDTYCFFSRSYRLQNYKLETISQEFLGVGKNPVTPQDIFELYSHHNEKDLGTIVDYCMKDCELPVRLFEKVKIWPELVETSNVTRVGIFDLYTRGQGIRVFSQEYYRLHRRGYLVEKKKGVKEEYEGGYVFDGVPGLYDDIFCFDFASLYPSIMISHNLCYTSLLNENDPTPDHMCHVIEWDDGKTGKHYKFRWIKNEFHKGVLSELLQELALERKRVKKLMIPLEEKIKDGSISPEELVQYNRLDAQQKSIKVSMNSVYGDKGSHMSKLPLLPAAICTTFIGRDSIQKTAKGLEDKYKTKTIYGDSVTGDTPILVKRREKIGYITMEELFKQGREMHLAPEGDKQYVRPRGVEIWSDQGFTPVKYVMKHKYKGKIIRVHTRSGVVDCTEDHSLLNLDGKEIKPGECKVGNLLLHSKLPDFPPDVGHRNRRNKLDVAKWFQVLCRLGYKVEVEEEGGVYNLVTRGKGDSREIVKMVDVSDQYPEADVYDVETDNHHFAAGIGEMVVHNTDSCMEQIPNLKRHMKHCKVLGEKIAEVASSAFLQPMKLEFEKGFLRFFLIQKKMYAGFLINFKNLEADLDKMTEQELDKIFFCRGIPIARRDNCNFLRRLYKKVLYMIMLRRSREEVLSFVEEQIRKLLSRQVPFDDLVITKKLGKNYKSESFPLAIFQTYLKERGELLEAGDRLEYIFVESVGHKILQGYKMQSPKFYHMDENMIDVDYYLTNVVATPINKIISIAFPGIPKTYILKQMYRFWQDRMKYLGEIGKPIVLKKVETKEVVIL